MKVMLGAVGFMLVCGVLIGAVVGGVYIVTVAVVAYGNPISGSWVDLIVGGVPGAAIGGVMGVVDGVALGLITLVNFNPLADAAVHRRVLVRGNAITVFAIICFPLAALVYHEPPDRLVQVLLLGIVPALIAGVGAGYAAGKYADRYARYAARGQSDAGMGAPIKIVLSAAGFMLIWGVLIGAVVGVLYVVTAIAHSRQPWPEGWAGLIVGGARGALIGGVMGALDGAGIGLIARVKFRGIAAAAAAAHRRDFMVGNASTVFAVAGTLAAYTASDFHYVTEDQSFQVAFYALGLALIAGAGAGYAAGKYADRYARRARPDVTMRKRKRGEGD